MSVSPHWEVIPIPPKERSLPHGIKYPIARRYMDHDGSLSGSITLGMDDLPYLQGLKDGSNPESDTYKGASILIEEIEHREFIKFVIA